MAKEETKQEIKKEFKASETTALFIDSMEQFKVVVDTLNTAIGNTYTKDQVEDIIESTFREPLKRCQDFINKHLLVSMYSKINEENNCITF